MFDPNDARHIALGDITGTSGMHFLIAVNRMPGGELDDQGRGFEAIKELMPNVVMPCTQADQLVPLFERGEIVMAPWYPDRIGSAAKSLLEQEPAHLLAMGANQPTVCS